MLTDMNQQQGWFLFPNENMKQIKKQYFNPNFFRRKIVVNQNQPLTGLRFRLAIDESVMGLPRMAFVLIFGCIGLLAVGCGALLITCFSQRRKDKNYYSFSLLSQKPEQRKLFEDDDDVDETELFRTPIKGIVFVVF